MALIATGLLALSAPASAAPLPQLWTACFVEENRSAGGSGADECNLPGGLAADPNVPGHLYVADSFNNRINEFNAWGAFVKSWGWGVADGSLEAQTCGPEATPPTASCQQGIPGPGGGQLGGGAGVEALAVDSAGDLYVLDRGNSRIQKFDSDGAFLRAWGGGVVSGGATGTGDLDGTATVSNLVATEKAFRVGQTVTSSDGGIPAGTTITDVTTGPAATLTLSQPATTTQGGVTLTAAEGSGNVPTNEIQTIELFNPTAGAFTLTVAARQGHAAHTTASIDHDAPAAIVQEELEEAGGMVGNVEVAGPEGGPYEVEFKAALADTDVALLSAESSGFSVGAGSELRCRAGVKRIGDAVDSDPRDADLSYQWLANGESLGAANGAQTPTYTVQAADEGKAIQCRVTATNRIADINFPSVHAATVAISAATVVPAVPSPAPPQPTGAAPEIGGAWGLLDGTEAKEIVCNAGSWANEPTSYTYQWLRNGAPFGSPTTTEATSSPLVLNAAEQQEPATFQCEITAENPGGASVRSSGSRNTSGDYFPGPRKRDAVAELALPAATPATTVAGGGAAEVCALAAECQEGVAATGPGQLGDARGIAIDHKETLGSAADDVVYLGGAERIQSFDAEGNHTGEIPFTGAPAPEPGTVGSLAVEGAGGDIYFAYQSDTSVAESNLIAEFTGEAVQPDVHRLDPATGQVTDTLDVAIPTAIATAPDGSVYVFDHEVGNSTFPGNHIRRVLKFDAAGDPIEPPAVQNSGPDPFDPDDMDQFLAGSVNGLATGSACFSATGHDLYATHSGGHADLHGEFARAWGPAPTELEDCPRPEVAPAIAAQYAVFVDDDTATVRAKIDPRFWGDTSFYVQYATAACIEGEEEWEGECVQEEPAAPGVRLDPQEQVASGEKETPDVVLSDLTPGNEYRYRFVAESGFELKDTNGPVFGEGGTLGEDGAANGFRTFPTSLPPEPLCPNDALRSGTPSQHLPDCRAYEQVSPVDKNGQGVIPAPIIASRAGEAVTFVSRGAFSGAPVGAFPNGYGALRETSGWPAHPLSAPIDPIAALYTGSLYGASEDTRRSLVGTTSALHPDAEAGDFNLYVHDSTTGAYEFVGEVPGLDPSGMGSVDAQQIKLAGASADGSCFYFTVPGDFRLDSTPPPRFGAGSNLYGFCGGELSLVGALPGESFGVRAGSDIGKPAGGVGGPKNRTSAGAVDAPAGRAVSSDGSRVYWQSAGDLYLHEGEGSGLVAEEADFEYASADGRFAFLTRGADLHRFDAGSEALSGITEGEAGVERVLGASEDGAFAYFLAGAALAPGAIAGEDNLYAWREGEGVRLIGRLDTAAEGIREARVSANGRYLGFLFGGEIAGPHPYKGWPENPRTVLPFTQAYLYDHGEDTLACASCPPADGPAGGHPHGDTLFHGPELGTGELNTFSADEGLSRNVSDRGELFFHTPARLVRRDNNGVAGCPPVDLGIAKFVSSQAWGLHPACTDVYRYRDDETRLLSAADETGPAFFGDASADGRDAFIVTASQLVGQDRDADFDLYDARVEGGIAAQGAPEPPICEGDECREQGPEPPADAAPATPEIEGRGNVVPRPTRCTRLARAAARQARKAKALRARARRLGGAAKRSAKSKRAKAARRKARRLTKAAHKRGKFAKRRSARGKRCRRAARGKRR